MPTAFDAFTEQAHSTYPHLPPDVLENRALFHQIMRRFNFEPLPTEWWHFDFVVPQLYPIVDVTFAELLHA